MKKEDWTPELDQLLRQWHETGVTNKEGARILTAMGYRACRSEVSKRRRALGLVRYSFIWENHPEAAAYFDRWWGYRKAKYITRDLQAMGYRVTLSKVYDRAKNTRTHALAPDENINPADAAPLLGYRQASGTWYALHTLRLPSKGRGHCRFVTQRTLECLCAFRDVPSPYSQENRSHWIGREVRATCALRAVRVRGRLGRRHHMFTMLVPKEREPHQHFARHQLVGKVVAIGSSWVEIATSYGHVRVPSCLLELHQDATACIPTRIAG